MARECKQEGKCRESMGLPSKLESCKEERISLGDREICHPSCLQSLYFSRQRETI